ncbi:SGNH/GDSL hydrolase family protein [Dyadobacter crusticola]|uniref:SGNH/GDSL hydrolase family protein n=1 Tax=Dyadobacter crusticola TaxID=292407 RepID=UPI000B114D38|nr:SGNH/GDSL hydrolase family protein [Dyadobacter crusticola]
MIEDQESTPKIKNSKNALSRRRFFHHSGAALLATTFLTSCEGLLDDILPKKNGAEKGEEESGPKRDQTLAFFGDSLTIGAGGTTPYGNMVGEAFPGRPIVSDGIVGQVALSIAIRQGGTPLKISVQGGKFDGTNEIKVTKLNNEFLSTPINYETYSRTGTIVGVKCTITRTANDNGESYTIKPDAESTLDIPEGSIFELDDATRLRTATQILWYGRNNITKGSAQDEILEALDSSIAFIEEPKRYLVVGMLQARPENRGTDRYNQVISINEKLASRYGSNYVPMTPPTADEMAAINYTPTEQDLADIENMNFPTGMRPDDRSDEIHINDKGYRIVANRVISKLKELKY